MPKTFLPFRELSPDLGHWKNPGMLEVRNVVPVGGHYAPLSNNTTTSGPADWFVTAAAGSKPGARGLHVLSTGNGTYRVFGGSATKLYSCLSSALGTFTDVSRAVGGAYDCNGAGGENGWQGTSAGIYAVLTNGVDAVQLWDPAVGLFSNLFTSTKKPLAKFLMMVGENLVCLNTNDAGVAQPTRAWWTQSNAFQNIGDRVNNPEMVGTGFQDLQDDYGHITGGIGLGRTGWVFKEAAIISMSGPPYTFDTALHGYGTVYPNSIAALGDEVFFWSDGPCRLASGSPDRLSLGTLFRTLTDPNISTESALSTYLAADSKEHISCAVDPAANLVFWAITSTARDIVNGSAGTSAAQQGDLLVIYNVSENRFSFVEPTTDLAAITALSVGVLYLENRPPAPAERWTPGRGLLFVQRAAAVDLPGTAAFWSDTLSFFAYGGTAPAPSFRHPFEQIKPGIEIEVVKMRPIYSLKTGTASRLSVSIDLYSKNRPFEEAEVVTYNAMSEEDGWLHPAAGAIPISKEFHSPRTMFSKNGATLITSAVEFEGIEIDYAERGATA
jgi:hypothetical protein